MTYSGRLLAYGVRDFPRSAGQTFTILKPKGGKEKVDVVETEDEAGTYWLLRNNTSSNVQYEVEIT